jgi:hypothetical protein
MKIGRERRGPVQIERERERERERRVSEQVRRCGGERDKDIM